MKPPPLIVPGVLEMVPVDAIASNRREAIGASPTEALHEIVIRPPLEYRFTEDVTNWKNSYIFVALEDLSLEDRIEHFPQYEKEWRALAAPASDKGSPYRSGEETPLQDLVSILARTPLLLVGSTDGRNLTSKLDLKGDWRIVEVGFARNADDYFHFSVSRGGNKTVSISGAYYSLRAHFDFGGEPKEYEDGDYDWDDSGRLLDRLMRTASHGLVSSRAIGLAFVLSGLESSEAFRSAVTLPSAGEHALGTEIIAALAAADSRAETIATLPIYGTAYLEILPSFILGEQKPPKSRTSIEASASFAGASEIVVPAERIWIVRDVEWVPPDVSPRFAAPIGRVSPIKRPGAWLFLVALAVLIILAILHKLWTSQPA